MTRRNTINRVPDGYEEALLKALEYQAVRRNILPDIKEKKNKNEVYTPRRNNNDNLQ